MNFEYVISGLTMGIDDLYYNPKVAAPYIHHMNKKIQDMNNKYDNQNMSILFNSLTDRKHGVTRMILWVILGIEYSLTLVGYN